MYFYDVLNSFNITFKYFYVNLIDDAWVPQPCNAPHISLSRSAVQMRGFLMPLASS